MDETRTFHEDVTTFYQRWHALERALGPKGGLVIDFDMAPRGADPVRAYASREDAFEVLVALQRRLPGQTGLANPTFLAARLGGSETYLRALMGERLPFHSYLSRTMGIDPTPPTAEALAEGREEARRRLTDRGVAWSPEGRTQIRDRFGRSSLDGFEAELRQAARTWVARLRARVHDLPEPEYRIEVANVDAYWANWIDGSVESGVTLKVNTHPRTEYNRWSPMALAAHEIAGHAVHVACLRRAATEEGGSKVDPCALNLTVHACEAFQMEGLAQSMLTFLAEPDELDADFLALEAYRQYAKERINLAQHELEAGQPIDEVCGRLIADCPLSKPLTVRSDLRDRAWSPLMRSYVYVYAPSQRLFLQATKLEPKRQAAFLRDMLTGLWTPEQIAARVG